jgi:D-glycero-alpha-D-manno-heptose-7-phosphate kinase
MILSKTPVRIAFGGGGTDVEPYSKDFNGYVVNATIDKYIRTVLSRRNDNFVKIFADEKFFSYPFKEIESFEFLNKPPDLIKAILYFVKPRIGMDVYIHGEPPKKAGLGSSASLSTSFIAGILKIKNKTININDIAEKAYKVEQNVLRNAGGRQDQYASVYGGFNGINFLGDSNVKVERLNFSKTFKRFIEKNLLLYYTGEPHTSGSMVSLQIQSYLEKKELSIRFLDRLKQIAYEIRDSLISENYEVFGKLLTKDLTVKSQFNPYIITDHMNQLNNLVIKNGGLGGRVCGAGGGGCMIWLIPPNSREKIKSLLHSQPGYLIEYKFIDNGLQLSNI